MNRHDEPDDATLVGDALAGQAHAAAALVHRWTARILALCHARLRRRDVAEDMTQDTFLKAFRSLHTLTDRARFGSWLLGIAMRNCLDWVKKRQNGQLSFSTIADGGTFDGLLAPEDDSGVISPEQRRRVLAEIHELPEDHRQAIMLFYYDELTYRQAAELLGVSAATINARLTRARCLLRERLADCRR